MEFMPISEYEKTCVAFLISQQLERLEQKEMESTAMYREYKKLLKKFK